MLEHILLLQIVLTLFKGKTTQIPLMILDDHVKRGQRCKIWVTQPRRMAAVSIAEHVAYSRPG